MAVKRSWGNPQRIAVLSVHTSPLDQPGTGDAGGMNVYVVESARRLAAAGIEVDIFTRADSSDAPAAVEMEPGVTVRHVRAGPFEGLRKEDLPAQLCAFSAGLLSFESHRPEGWYDLVHSHYWLSGHVGWLASQRWNVPLVHSMHTMAKVKNADLADGDRPEPHVRVIGEEQVVDAATRLVANTVDEANDLRRLYGAPTTSIDVVHPGVDLDVFQPGDKAAARLAVGLAPHEKCLLFVGRLQPLKAPDVLLRAAHEMLMGNPALALVIAVNGGPSGTGLEHPTALSDLAVELNIADRVRFEPPVDRHKLAQWYRAADITVVPSYSESFGLVAVESQACGTPVVAANVGGLRTAVADGISGVLIPSRDPREWATTLTQLLNQPQHLTDLGRGGIEHARKFSWDATASGLIASYGAALAAHRTDSIAASQS
ncbi:MAG: D-inositol-3-phosphate glycosyltransferase [Candidatus Nanopelagicales bacterium]